MVRCFEEVAEDGVLELHLGWVEHHEIVEALLTRLDFVCAQIWICAHLSRIEEQLTLSVCCILIDCEAFLCTLKIDHTSNIWLLGAHPIYGVSHRRHLHEWLRLVSHVHVTQSHLDKEDHALLRLAR